VAVHEQAREPYLVKCGVGWMGLASVGGVAEGDPLAPRFMVCWASEGRRES
jgi:hypothetical protein